MIPSADKAATKGRLVELAVTDLGIIERLTLVFGPGMTVLTGETGAGKTMVVGAIELLLGGRADASIVRSGASEAVVEGRFDVDGEELVLARVVPADGRSRAYVNGRMATAAVLAEQAAAVVDLHGQHGHQSLLAPRTQRAALDRFAGIDLGPLQGARAECRRLAHELRDLGGDAGARAREADLLRFQLDELRAANLSDPEEDTLLDEQEDLLAGAVGHAEVAAQATELLSDDDGVVDGIGRAVASLDGHAPFSALVERLRAVQAEVADVAAGTRALGEAIEDDPARLAEIRERRHLLVDVRRKYGSASVAGVDGDGLESERGGVTRNATLHDVIAYRDAAAARLARLDHHDEAAASLEGELAVAGDEAAAAALAVGRARRGASPALAEAVTGHLQALAMAGACMEVVVGDEDPGDDVVFLLAANPGSDPAPLSRVASGGELARTMLALRLVLSAAPPVLVFDEVDAGIGGRAALAVGRSLARLGADHQVVVVTHLPQVAAFADHQVHVHKTTSGEATRASARLLEHDARVVELSRMLSGTPESETMREAATELLQRATAERGR